jgi:hypothetical protein
MARSPHLCRRSQRRIPLWWLSQFALRETTLPRNIEQLNPIFRKLIIDRCGDFHLAGANTMSGTWTLGTAVEVGAERGSNAKLCGRPITDAVYRGFP